MSATPQDESDEVETDEVEEGQGEAGEVEAGPVEAIPEEYLDGQEEDSFPASDPHSDWSGPPERE